MIASLIGRSDNGRGMDTVPGPHLIKDSYFECESANPGNVRQAPWNPVYGRSRAVWYNSKIPICGFEVRSKRRP